MKATFKKLIIMGVIMATLMSLLLGCDAVDKKATDPILTQLSEKYGKSFTIYALGNRIGNDTATAYVFADDDPDMLFTVRVTTDGVLEYEEYAYRTVCRKAEDMVIAAFAEHGMDAVCICRFSPLSNDTAPGTDPLAYIEAHNPEVFGITIVIRDGSDVTAERIVEVYREIHADLNNTFIGTGVYVVSSQDFDTVHDKVRMETQSFDAYRLYLKGTQDPIRQVKFQMSSGNPTKTVEEIQAELDKEGF